MALQSASGLSQRLSSNNSRVTPIKANEVGKGFEPINDTSRPTSTSKPTLETATDAEKPQRKIEDCSSFSPRFPRINGLAVREINDDGGSNGAAFASEDQDTHFLIDGTLDSDTACLTEVTNGTVKSRDDHNLRVKGITNSIVAMNGNDHPTAAVPDPAMNDNDPQTPRWPDSDVGELSEKLARHNLNSHSSSEER